MAAVESLKSVARGIGKGLPLKQLAREARWAGDTVRCSCCGWRGRAFRPSCHDRPGVTLLCARCMSGPDERAILLKLRELTPSLPSGARILDVEPLRYTRHWFSRYNQFDYRTLGHAGRDVDIQGDLESVTLTKGICNLIVCSRGVEPTQDLMAALTALRRWTGADGTMLVGTPADTLGGDPNGHIRHLLQEVGFEVVVDDLVQRLRPDLVQRYGLSGSRSILVCTTDDPLPHRQHAHQH